MAKEASAASCRRLLLVVQAGVGRLTCTLAFGGRERSCPVWVTVRRLHVSAIFTIRDRQICSVEYFFDHDKALQAGGRRNNGQVPVSGVRLRSRVSLRPIHRRIVDLDNTQDQAVAERDLLPEHRIERSIWVPSDRAWL